MTYNGWTNWETWQILLWCNNDEGAYRWKREWLEDQRGVAPDERDVELFFRGMFPNGTPDMDSADDLDDVDWDEIATHIQTEWKEIHE